MGKGYTQQTHDVQITLFFGLILVRLGMTSKRRIYDVQYNVAMISTDNVVLPRFVYVALMFH